MNTLISYNWLKEYVKTKLDVEEFARKTTNAGNSVERMHDLSKRYEGMVVGVVKELKAHPNADKLKLVETDIGGSTVEIVCGGTNVAVGMRVAVALPGARVKWHGEGDWVALEKTKIRGVESHGMICAAEEIGFEKLALPGPTIWDLTDLTDAKAGTPLADALDLDDTVMDIEVTSNRPDCMGVIGQAREGSAVTGDAFTWQETKLAAPAKASRAVSVEVKDKDLCPRYQAVVLENVKVGPSPWWLQKRLLLSGHRPINNVVDVTNYVLQEYGQPLHAFDADKLGGKSIIVRRAKKGEQILALDGKTYELASDMLVIADKDKPVAIAGVMGGEATGTTERTTSLVIESATFDPVSVRRTSRKLNLQSDSQLLFEKGLSTESTTPALARAVELLKELTGASIASKVYDVRAKKYEPRVFLFDPAKASELMGSPMPAKEMLQILKRLGFEPKASGKKGYRVEVPYWRDHDIDESIDLVEEVARVRGYDTLPSILPVGELPKREAEPKVFWERRLKERLAGAGFSEVYSFAFVSEIQLSRYGMKTSEAVHLQNPLSEDQAYMRPSLIPTMLTAVEANQHHFAEAAMFEIAPTYVPVSGDLPLQRLHLLLCLYGKDGEALLLRVKGALARLLREAGAPPVDLSRGVHDSRWHESRTAAIRLPDGVEVGVIGQVAEQTCRAFGIDTEAALVSIDLEALVPYLHTSRTYIPIPEFPGIKRDLAFVVKARTEYADVESALRKANPLVRHVELFDVYSGEGIPEGHASMAVHVTLRADDRTLSSAEADDAIQTLCRVLEKQFSATIRT